MGLCVTANPSVAILIPAYNAETSIAEAIESALAQHGVEKEVIVIDDGSSDGTLDIIRRFNGQIKWETGPNRGAPSARNRALALSSAPWIQYLDADDYLTPDKIAGQLSALKQKPKADLVYGPSTIEWHRSGRVEERVESISEPRDPFRLLALWQLPQTGAVLFRRDALISAGAWKEDQPCCQEHELYLRMLMNGAELLFDSNGGSVYRRFETGTLSTSDLPMVRSERRKIENRLESFLNDNDQLTPSRKHAINQARLNMARAAWTGDRREAYEIHKEISAKDFKPDTLITAKHYALVYQLFGFRFAEWVAFCLRNIKWSKGR